MPKLAKLLSGAQIKREKATTKPAKLFDGHALYIEVHPTGGKFWRFRYRQTSAKETGIAFCPYPEVTLVDARDKRTEARRVSFDGQNLM